MRFFRKQYVQTPGKKPPLTPETAVAAAVDESHAHENTDSEIQEAVLHRVPSGAVMIWGGDLGANPIPSGWLLCNGASYLRTDYPDLFAAIGTVHRSADSDHFAVPAIGGCFVPGADGSTYDPVDTGGSATHSHGATGLTLSGSVKGTTPGDSTANFLTSATTVGGDTAAVNGLPPYYAMPYMIKT